MKPSAMLLVVIPGLVACDANNPSYFAPPGPLEVGQMDGAEAAFGVVTLDFRTPTADEEKTRVNASGAEGYQVPWLRADREGLELLYTITNLDKQMGEARIQVDGASELVSYDTAAQRAAIAALPEQQQEDAPTVLSLIRPTPLVVPPGQSISGIVGEDEFLEAALDLDAIGRWMAVPAQVLINRSEQNRVGLEMVPKQLIRPGFFQVQVSFSATTHMRCEYLVRVRDEDHLLRAGHGYQFKPTPMVYTPALPMPAMPAMPAM